MNAIHQTRPVRKMTATTNNSKIRTAETYPEMLKVPEGTCADLAKAELSRSTGRRSRRPCTLFSRVHLNVKREARTRGGCGPF